jgi:hypothetical protein
VLKMKRRLDLARRFPSDTRPPSWSGTKLFLYALVQHGREPAVDPPMVACGYPIKGTQIAGRRRSKLYQRCLPDRRDTT